MDTQPTTTTNEVKPVTPAAGGFKGGARRGNFPPRGSHRRGGEKGGDRGGQRGGSRGGGQRERVRSEYDTKMINIRRVARVTSGGRRFSFSVALVAGDRKGSVGVGLGKAGDTALAIDKATRNAKKNMIRIPLTKTSSIAHEVEAKVGPSRVVIRPASGRGLVAGSSVRTVLELAGVRDVSARILSRSKNQLNNARAATAALTTLSASRRPRLNGEKKEHTEEAKQS